MKNLVPAAKLRSLTNRKAKADNRTRWSSTFEILRRFKQLYPYLEKLEIKDLDDL